MGIGLELKEVVYIMKKLFITLVLLTLITSCENDSLPDEVDNAITGMWNSFERDSDIRYNNIILQINNISKDNIEGIYHGYGSEIKIEVERLQSQFKDYDSKNLNSNVRLFYQLRLVDFLYRDWNHFITENSTKLEELGTIDVNRRLSMNGKQSDNLYLIYITIKKNVELQMNTLSEEEKYFLESNILKYAFQSILK